MGPDPAEPRYPSDDLAQAVLGPAAIEIFENLYVAYAGEARQAAYGLLRDRELAADAAHAAYIELLRYILAGKRWMEPSEARAAVTRNATWAALKILRTRRRRPELAMDTAVESVVDDGAWARAEARAICEQVVARLRPDQQSALRLHFVEGLSNAESAERLGISVGAFESRLLRAVRASRRAARTLGLTASLALALRAAVQRVRRTRIPRTASARVRIAAPIAILTAAAALAGAGELVSAATPREQQGALLVHRSPPAFIATTTRPPDTVEDSLIIDALKLSPTTAVLLGEGRRCSCGIVFVTRDAGRAWSSIAGPRTVTGGDRLGVAAGTDSADVYVLKADGSTFLSPRLSNLARIAVSGPHSSWTPVLPLPCTPHGGRVVCGGVPGPMLPGSASGWLMALESGWSLYVGADHRPHCSADAGATWSEDCGPTS